MIFIFSLYFYLLNKVFFTIINVREKKILIRRVNKNMKERIIQLKEMFQSCKGINTEVSEKIVQETLKIFEYILYKTQSNIPEERQEAAELANELKTLLDEQSSTALKELNMTPEQLETFVSNNRNFSKEEWQALQNAKNSVNNYKSNLVKDGVIPEEEKAPKKYINKKAWIAS